MTFYSDRPPLFVSATAQRTGTSIDLRAADTVGYLFYEAAGASGIFNIDVSHNATAWMPFATYTAITGTTGTAQLSAFFPYMRANFTTAYSGAAGSAILSVVYVPRMV